ncbi:MAG: aldo/keto reductase [Planctomycetota bacterium]|jgi:diketogulonate reductase-like aldo/keto reductase
MIKRPFGNARAKVPVVGIGTWMIEKDDRATAVAAIRRSIDEGACHIDTAEMYGSGRAEEVVGEAIRDIRNRVFLVSKVLPSNASYDGTIRACEKSLRRLGTDHLDVYLLHWPGNHPLEETFRAFDKLARDGKTRAFGVSNFDVEEMKQAVAIAGKGRIACNQVYYHLRERTIERELVPWCGKHGVAIVGYSPFDQDRFPGPRSPARRTLLDIANARNASVRQVALAFLLRLEGTFTIPKSGRVEHVLENVAAAGLQLTPSDIRRIDKAFPVGARKSLPII